MANDIAKRDDNRIPNLMAVTNDSAQELRNLKIDPATGGLLVKIEGGGGGDNFANANLTLDANRQHLVDTFNLEIFRTSLAGLPLPPTFSVTTGEVNKATSFFPYIVGGDTDDHSIVGLETELLNEGSPFWYFFNGIVDVTPMMISEVSGFQSLIQQDLNNGFVIGQFEGSYYDLANITGGVFMNINAPDSEFGVSILGAGGTDTLGLRIDDLSFEIKTKNIVIGSATAGQVLTLVDETTGEVEYADVAGGGATASNGLTETAGDITLGGTLTGDTTINGDSAYNILFQNTTDFNIVSAGFGVDSSDKTSIVSSDNLSLATQGGSTNPEIYMEPNTSIEFRSLSGNYSFPNGPGAIGQALQITSAGVLTWEESATGVLPAYATTALASADIALASGAYFKVTNGDGTSAIHVKD